MILVIDANIIFSTVLNPSGTIATAFFELSKDHIFLAPDFLQSEINKHTCRLTTLTGKSPAVINSVLQTLYSNIIFYPDNVIPSEIDNHAFHILKGNDEKDLPYLCFSLFFQCKLWTGDKPLRSALESKGLNICISTAELLSIK